ncbi:MAG: CHAP domain-containing protein [Pannonibacter sp.]
MPTRRQLLLRGAVSGGLAAGFGLSARAENETAVAAVDTNPFSQLGFLRPEDDPEFGPLISGLPLGAQTVGTEASRHEEVSRAFRILWDAPRTDNPLELAQYFEAIQDENPNAKNASGLTAKYNEEWVGRANPLITSFFGMTATMPSKGDQTSWCSAFVSFVLYATGKATMLSALSGSYRKYSTATTTPEVGDIVVFRKNGDEGNQGFGHVGFFISETDDEVTVLGGNQGGSTGSTGAVCQSVYKKFGSTLTLHSYRKVKSTEFV